MITSITLENFKCFRKVEVNPRRITAFVGPNGTGKSSVLQALDLLKQTIIGGGLRIRGALVNLRAWEQLQPNFEQPIERIRWGCAGNHELPPQMREKTNQSSVFSCTVEIVDRTPKVSSNGDPSETLRNLRMVPAARGLVRPIYSLGNETVDDIPLADGLAQVEQQTATNLGYMRQLEAKISSWLYQVTGVGLKAEIVPSQAVQVTATHLTGNVNIVAEGFGTNALVLLFLQLAGAKTGATVLIEEPEIHLHPKAQAELASVLVEEALAEDKQIIMTTHSEHIVGRLLTLVAEKKLTPDDVAIYAFEKDEKGECTASEIKVFEDGRVEGGIKDFFETNLEEMNRYVQAQFARLQPEE